MEIKESYKERLSESGDNSGLIVVISANWMTLGFANAKRNVQAPARDPSENSALAARNFAEPFSYEALAARGLGREGRRGPQWGKGAVGVVAQHFLGPATAAWMLLAASFFSPHFFT